MSIANTNPMAHAAALQACDAVHYGMGNGTFTAAFNSMVLHLGGDTHRLASMDPDSRTAYLLALVVRASA